MKFSSKPEQHRRDVVWTARRGAVPVQAVLVAAVVIAAALAAFLFLQLSQLKSRLTQAQQQVANLTTQTTDLQGQIATLDTQRRELTAKADGLKGQLAASASESQQLQTALKDMQDRYDDVQRRFADAQQQLKLVQDNLERAKREAETAVNAKKESEQALNRMRERYAFLNRDYKKMTDRLEELESKKTSDSDGPKSNVVVVGSDASPDVGVGAAGSPAPSAGSTASSAAGSAVELPAIVVRRPAGATTGGRVQAEIVEANEPHRFIVINRGAMNGVQVGMMFDIMDRSGAIGQAVAIRVRPDLTACDVISTRSSSFPRVGATVMQRGT